MIPLIKNHTTLSPPTKHLPYSQLIEKVKCFETFLALKSQSAEVYSPSSTICEESSCLSDQIQVEKQEPPTLPSPMSPKKTLCDDVDSYLNKKKEILIPSNKRVQPTPLKFEGNYERIFKQQKSQLHYIRFDYGQKLPRDDVYEPTDKDIKFISDLNQEILDGGENFNESHKITEKQFGKLIEKWEHETADSPSICLDQAILAALGSLEEINISNNEILSKIYGYWKGLREKYRRPLLRKYWKSVNSDMTNPNLAFLKRKENKFARRRSQRTSSPEDDLKRMKALKKNIERGMLLMSNLKYRETLKLELLELQLKAFKQKVQEDLDEDLIDLEIYQPFNVDNKEENYLKAKMKMQEEKKKGEIILQSIKRLKKGNSKTLGNIVKRKLSLTQLSSSSMSTVTSKEALLTPMQIDTYNFNNYLPRNIEGNFVLPIRKSSIEINELKAKLIKSLGGLYLSKFIICMYLIYLGNQEEPKVKVEVNVLSDKKKQQSIFKPENNEYEGLIIKVDLDEVTEDDLNKPSQRGTRVKYSINFRESPQNQTFHFEAIENNSQKFNRNFLHQSHYAKFSSTKKEIMNCKGISVSTLNKELDGKIFNVCATGEY